MSLLLNSVELVFQTCSPDGSEDEGSRKRRRTDEESSEGGTDAGSSPSTSDEANQQQPLRPEGESASAVTSRSGRTGRLKVGYMTGGSCH